MGLSIKYPSLSLFAISAGIGINAQYIYFFIAYTLLNTVFYTANNIAYSALTSLITKNSNERVQMGTFRFIGATPGNVLVSNYTLVMVEKFGGGAAGWKTTAIIFAVIGLAVNTISVFFKDLPEEELMDGIKVSAIINLGFFLINLVSTSFGMKVGGGIGSALSGWLLAAAKFDASALTQSAGSSNMLTFMFAGIPVIITAIIVFIYFKLDVEKANTKLRAEKDLALN